MSKKIKVLQVLGDPVGGIRKHVHDIITNLNKDFVFYYVSSNNVDLSFSDEIKRIDPVINSRKQLNISKEPSISDLKNLFIVYCFVKRNKIGVIHGHGAKGGLYARIVGFLCGCKVIYTPHGGAAHDMFTPFKDKIYKSVEKLLYYPTNVFLFESHYTKKSFLNRIGRKGTVKSVVNFNGIDLSSYLPVQYSSNSPIVCIGFFGMLRKEKGVLFSLDVIARLIEFNKNIRYHVYGAGQLMSQVQVKINDLKIEDFVTLHGETETPYIHMQKMDIVFMPSMFESFGYVAVESMIFEKSLVFSSAGALPDTCEFNREYMFESGSVDDAVEKLALAIDTFDTEESRERLKVVAKMASSKYSIGGMTNTIRNIYENI